MTNFIFIWLPAFYNAEIFYKMSRIVLFLVKIVQVFIFKLVDCLEKCLICRHIRRFAD